MATTFPATANAFLTAVETIAEQNIGVAKSSNRIEGAYKEYAVENGKVIEDILIAKASGTTFNPTADGSQPDLSPKDPTIYVQYFSDWTPKQYKVSTRQDEIRAVVARGTTAEEFASKIVESLTEGEGTDDNIAMISGLKTTSFGMDMADLDAAVIDFSDVSTMKGVLFAIRFAYDMLRGDNKLEKNTPTGSGVPTAYSVNAEDIRVAIPEKILSLIDLVELANVFNLSKEDIMGRIVPLPLDQSATYNVIRVYDVNAYGRGTRTYEYSSEEFKGARYTNHYLNTERCYFHNGNYKDLRFDASKAVNLALNAL